MKRPDLDYQPGWSTTRPQVAVMMFEGGVLYMRNDAGQLVPTTIGPERIERLKRAGCLHAVIAELVAELALARGRAD